MAQVIAATLYPQAGGQASIVLSQSNDETDVVNPADRPVLIGQPKFIYNQAQGYRITAVLGIQAMIEATLGHGADTFAVSLVKANAGAVKKALQSEFPVIEKFEPTETGVKFDGSATGTGMNPLSAELYNDFENNFMLTAKVPVIYSVKAGSDTADVEIDRADIELSAGESGTALWHVFDTSDPAADEITSIEQEIDSLPISSLDKSFVNEIKEQLQDLVLNMTDLDFSI